jgi:hypothetical protein
MLVRLDAVFEVGLGAALLAAAAAGALDGGDFPRPVGTAAVAVVGAGLLLVGGVIWSGRLGLKALAGANAVFALAAVVWLAAADGFSAAGTAVVSTAAAGLTVLATAQAATLRS